MPPHLIYGPTAAVLAVTTALVATVCAVRPTRVLVTVTAVFALVTSSVCYVASDTGSELYKALKASLGDADVVATTAPHASTGDAVTIAAFSLVILLIPAAWVWLRRGGVTRVPGKVLSALVIATAAGLLYFASVAAAEGIASMWANHVPIGG